MSEGVHTDTDMGAHKSKRTLSPPTEMLRDWSPGWIACSTYSSLIHPALRPSLSCLSDWHSQREEIWRQHLTTLTTHRNGLGAVSLLAWFSNTYTGVNTCMHVFNHTTHTHTYICIVYICSIIKDQIEALKQTDSRLCRALPRRYLVTGGRLCQLLTETCIIYFAVYVKRLPKKNPLIFIAKSLSFLSVSSWILVSRGISWARSK